MVQCKKCGKSISDLDLDLSFCDKCLKDMTVWENTVGPVKVIVMNFGVDFLTRMYCPGLGMTEKYANRSKDEAIKVAKQCIEMLQRQKDKHSQEIIDKIANAEGGQ